jgi:DNA-binding CsgD family transcriptional regulator
MASPLDAYSATNAIALQIRKVQDGPIEYLACARRDPLLLTFHLKTIRALLSDLSKHIYRKIPQSIYSHHYRTTERIEEQLVALQGGFSTITDDPAKVSIRGKRSHIPVEDLKRLMKIGYTDKEIGRRFRCDKRTVYRRRLRLGLFRQAYMNSTLMRNCARYEHSILDTLHHVECQFLFRDWFAL